MLSQINKGDIVDVEYKEIMDNGLEYSPAFEINKFAYNLIQSFNERNRVAFGLIMGVNNSYVSTSVIDKLNTINLTFGMGNMKDEHDRDRLEGMKLHVAHTLSHNLYAGMNISSLDKLQQTVDRLANSYRKIIMACSIEIAADLHAKELYIEQGNKLNQTILNEYLAILCEGKDETEEQIVKYIKQGTLPPSFRLKYMKKYKSFKANNYEIVDEIISDMAKLAKRFMGKTLGLYNYEKWIIAQMELSNFPDRPNRQRKR